MKTALVLAAVAAAAMLFLWQRSDSRARMARDAATLAALQMKVDALAWENLALKQALQKKAAIRGALSTGLPLAMHYRASEKK